MPQKQIISSKLCEQAFGIDRYIKIMERLKDKTSIIDDTGFQKLYNGYYGVRRNETWRKTYYTLFQECRENSTNISFEYIVKELLKKVRQVEASFASKILASINHDMPIFDRRVLNYFKNYKDIELEITGNISKERIDSAVDVYKTILEKYHEKEQQEFIKVFDEDFPSYSSKISNIKKIDCFTWLLG